MSQILYGLILLVHILVSFVLIGVILLQGGRGGLSEALGGAAAAQSLFGGGAKTVLTKATAVCAGLFVVTCLSLAYLSTVQGRSVLEQIPMAAPEAIPLLPGVTPPPATPEPTPPVEPPQAEPTAPSEPAPSP